MPQMQNEAYSAIHVELLLCYAMAGGHVCMLRHDDPQSCLVLSGDHDIHDHT